MWLDFWASFTVGCAIGRSGIGVDNSGKGVRQTRGCGEGVETSEILVAVNRITARFCYCPATAWTTLALSLPSPPHRNLP